MSEIEAHESAGPSLKKKLIKACAIVLALVAVECVAATMLWPSAEQTEETARQLSAAVIGQAESSEQQEVQEVTAEQDVREVSLGSHSVTSYLPESDTTLRCDFELHAIVLDEDIEAFETLYENNRHRLSEQVHSTFRGAEITDMSEAGLDLIKRQILRKSNRTLGKPILRRVIFSRFTFMER